MIAVSGDALGSADGKHAVVEWYEGVGGMVKDQEGSLSITFPNREMAERVSRPAGWSRS